MQAQRHPQVPWVIVYPQADGSVVCVNERTRAQARCVSQLEVNQFAADNAGSQTHVGAGDVVSRIAGALGFKKCAPCAARQAAMNRVAPRMWRR